MPAFSQGEHFCFQLKEAWHVDYQLTLQKILHEKIQDCTATHVQARKSLSAYRKVEKQSSAQDGLQQDET